jgi:hypothetical protein
MQNPTLCPHCGARISANAQFCRSCGKSIIAEPTSAPRPAVPSAERKCPHCGAALSETAQFCKACGKSVAAPTSAPRQAMPPAERKCPHCGAAVSPTAAFCKECGKPLASAISKPEATPIAVPPVPALPGRLHSSAVSSPPTPKKERGGCGRPFACGCLATFFLCVVIGVGSYVAYQNDLITLDTALRLIGRAPASVTVYNFADDTIYLTISDLNTKKEESPKEEKTALTPLGLENRSHSEPGRYKYQFGTRAGGADLGVCTLTLRYNDKYQFVPLPGMIIVNRLNQSASTPSDFLVASSSLCR